MNIDHLDTFLDVVQTRNFHRSAERLGLNQSTVSTRIRALEDALGTRLFVRGRGGAELTAEGQTFESYALNIRLGWNLARQEIGMPPGYRSRLRVGMQVQLWDRLVTAWGVPLRQQLPGTAVHVDTDYSKAMIDQLVFGNLDIAVLYNPEYRPELQVTHMFDERFQMVATRPSRLADITPENYVLIAESPYFAARHAELLPQLQQPAFSVGIGSMSVTCLRAYGGAAYLPVRLGKALVARGEFYEVADAPTIEQPVFLTHLSKNRHRPLIGKAIEALGDVDINAPGYEGFDAVSGAMPAMAAGDR